MLKLKIIVSMLAVSSMTLLLTGSTYLTASLAVVCAAVALPMGGYLMWRYLIPEDHSLIPFVLCVPTAELPFMRALKDLGVLNVPLGATIEPDKAISLGGFIALTSAISVLIAVIAPSSPKYDNNSDDDSKG